MSQKQVRKHTVRLRRGVWQAGPCSLRILITCGATREPLDPVRFLSNYSTGEMGLALAREGLKQRHRVTLVHSEGVSVPKDLKVKKIAFDSTRDLQKILKRESQRHDVLFMAAAVSDYRPRVISNKKIRKNGRQLRIDLVQNPDVLAGLNGESVSMKRVGFCLESDHLHQRAREKMLHKKLDLIVAQRVTERSKPFGRTRLDASVIFCDGGHKDFFKISKSALSKFLLKEAPAIKR